MSHRPDNSPEPAKTSRLRLTPRQWLLFGVLGVVLAVYAATAPARAGVWERVWRQRQAGGWARQQQEEELDERRVRADLRAHLRRLAQEPEDATALMAAAASYGQLRRYDDALFMLDEATRLKPDDPEIYRARADIYFASGKYDRCLDA